MEEIEPRFEILKHRCEEQDRRISTMMDLIAMHHNQLDSLYDEQFKQNIRIAQLHAEVRLLKAPQGGMPGGSASGVPSLPVSKNADAHRPAPSHSPAKKLGSPSPNGFTADPRD